MWCVEGLPHAHSLCSSVPELLQPAAEKEQYHPAPSAPHTQAALSTIQDNPTDPPTAYQTQPATSTNHTNSPADFPARTQTSRALPFLPPETSHFPWTIFLQVSPQTSQTSTEAAWFFTILLQPPSTLIQYSASSIQSSSTLVQHSSAVLHQCSETSEQHQTSKQCLILSSSSRVGTWSWTIWSASPPFTSPVPRPLPCPAPFWTYPMCHPIPACPPSAHHASSQASPTPPLMAKMNSPPLDLQVIYLWSFWWFFFKFLSAAGLCMTFWVL